MKRGLFNVAAIAFAITMMNVSQANAGLFDFLKLGSSSKPSCQATCKPVKCATKCAPAPKCQPVECAPAPKCQPCKAVAKCAPAPKCQPCKAVAKCAPCTAKCAPAPKCQPCKAVAKCAPKCAPAPCSQAPAKAAPKVEEVPKPPKDDKAPAPKNAA